MSREAPSHRSATPNRGRESPGPFRSTSQHSSDRRPMGPRAPSPLPKSPLLLPSEIPEFDLPQEILMDVDQHSTPPRPGDLATPYRTGNRLPFLPTGNTNGAPHSANGASTSRIEPLSIKKKTSIRSNAPGSPMPARKMFTRTSPMSRGRIVSPRRVSPQVRTVRTNVHSSSKPVDLDRILYLAETTKEDVGTIYSHPIFMCLWLHTRLNRLIALLNAYDWNWTTSNQLRHVVDQRSLGDLLLR